MVPEQPVIIEHICAVEISSNFQFSAKVQKFGNLFLFPSLLRETFLVLGQKCKSFYLNNQWIGQAAHSQHCIDETIPVDEKTSLITYV